MKKLILSLLLIPSFLCALTLNVETHINKAVTTKSFQLSNDESATLTVGNHKLIISAIAKNDYALLNIKVFNEEQEEPVCNPQLVAVWDKEVTIKCPQEDVDASLVITATVIK